MAEAGRECDERFQKLRSDLRFEIANIKAFAKACQSERPPRVSGVLETLQWSVSASERAKPRVAKIAYELTRGDETADQSGSL